MRDFNPRGLAGLRFWAGNLPAAMFQEAAVFDHRAGLSGGLGQSDGLLKGVGGVSESPRLRT